MSLKAICDALPAYAEDLRTNLAAVEQDRQLSSQERWGCLLACAVAAGEPTLLEAVRDAAAETLGEADAETAKAAAAVTLMNDVYYGVIAGLRNPEYATQPSGLRMEALHHPGKDRDAFDLWCLAVSACDRCTPCIDAQEEELRKRGVPPARMQAAMRIAAVTRAAAHVLRAEAALSKKEDDMNGQDESAPGGAPKGDLGGDTPAPPTPHPAGTADPAVTTPPHPAPGDLEITPG